MLHIGLTEMHGMVDEYSMHPPDGIKYSFLNPTKGSSRILRSPIKGYFRHYASKEHDLIEATLSPIFTKNNWIYSVANFQESMAFNFCGCPLPRAIRSAFIQHLFLKENFKKLIFWSESGRKTLESYGKITDHRIIKKSIVIYPAIRKIHDSLICYNTGKINLLFSGDFFRKGGVNVIDTFENIQLKFPNINLILCCDEKFDFNTKNELLKNEYLLKIKKNEKIHLLGRISRYEMINKILPQTDIYLIPTYAEAFGYAILEAMAYGIPVISTNIFAIPEMINHGESGFLIDISGFDYENIFKGYVVNDIPLKFKQYINEKLKEFLLILITSKDLRRQFGANGLIAARSKFSFEVRNAAMNSLYHSVS